MLCVHVGTIRRGASEAQRCFQNIQKASPHVCERYADASAQPHKCGLTDNKGGKLNFRYLCTANYNRVTTEDKIIDYNIKSINILSNLSSGWIPEFSASDNALGRRLKTMEIQDSDMTLKKCEGWLVDECTGKKIWCVLTESSLYIFRNSTVEKPERVISLPGCLVKLPECDKAGRSGEFFSSKKSLCLEILNKNLPEVLLRFDSKTSLMKWAIRLKVRAEAAASLKVGKAIKFHASMDESVNGHCSRSGIQRNLKSRRYNRQWSLPGLQYTFKENTCSSLLNIPGIPVAVNSEMQNSGNVLYASGLQSKSEPDLSHVYSVKRSFFSKKFNKSKEIITLQMLTNPRFSGHLNYKTIGHFFKRRWTKLWCVVCQGYFYGFSSKKACETAQFSVSLADSTVTPVLPAKDRKNKFFINIDTIGKNVTLQPESLIDFSNWLRELTGEREVASAWHKPKSPLVVTSEFPLTKFTVPLKSSENDQLPADQTDGVPGKYHKCDAEERDTGYNTGSEDLESSSSTSSCQNNCCVGTKFEDVLLELSTDDQESRNEAGSPKHCSPEVSETAQECGNQVKMEDKTHNLKPCNYSFGNEPCTSPNHIWHKRQKQRPVIVKLISAHYLKDVTVSGIMEMKNCGGHWVRYCFALKDSLLYCYSTPNDQITSDILDISNCHIRRLASHFDRKYIMEISCKEYTPAIYAVETEEMLNQWLHHLKAVEASSTCSSSLSSEDFLDSQEDLTSTDDDQKEMTHSMKYQLLMEMLQLKCELLNKSDKQQNSLVSDGDFSDDHTEQIVAITRLTQKRMSKHLKANFIKKQLNSGAPRKSFFRFGNKKKDDHGQQEHLKDQLVELNAEIDGINRNLQCMYESPNYLPCPTGLDRQVAQMSVSPNSCYQFSSDGAGLGQERGAHTTSPQQDTPVSVFNFGKKSILKSLSLDSIGSGYGLNKIGSEHAKKPKHIPACQPKSEQKISSYALEQIEAFENLFEEFLKNRQQKNVS